jgi:aminoglycoside phosphotransferase family enzyme/predicted kinase
MLIVICGLPGTGKSTIARAVARRLSAECLNSDVVRKKLFPKPSYSEEEKLAVYRQMAQEAQALLKQGKNAVLDATFSRNEYVRLAKEAAHKAGAECRMVLCTLSDAEVRKRIEKREKGPSDADFAVYLKVKAQSEPVEGALVLDASKPINEIVRDVEQFVFGSMDEKKVEQLRKSLAAELVTTHISWVLLGKEFVYKIKRPAKFSFLDFTTLERRKLFCEEEVRLNRRLSPDVYLGVVPVTLARDGTIALGGEGRTIDYAVKMRKLPPGRRMDLLLKQGNVDAGHIRKIAGTIADFHNKIGVIKDKGYSSAQVVKTQIDDLANFRGAIEEACGMGTEVDSVLSRSDGFIKNNAALFAQRQEEGRIKDCHGDLHSANIFILEGGDIVIFDCIEFSKDFRYVDVASEIAFMAMDLDAFGREDLSELFVKEYLAKAQDPEFKTMLKLYKCYRANVRAKIAAIDYLGTGSGEAKKRIGKYMALAKKYAEEL